MQCSDCVCYKPLKIECVCAGNTDTGRFIIRIALSSWNIQLSCEWKSPALLTNISSSNFNFEFVWMMARSSFIRFFHFIHFHSMHISIHVLSCYILQNVFRQCIKFASILSLSKENVHLELPVEFLVLCRERTPAFWAYKAIHVNLPHWGNYIFSFVSRFL